MSTRNKLLRTQESYLEKNHLIRFPKLTKEQEIQLCQNIKKGDEKSFDTLVQSKLRLVITVANKYLWSNIPKEDLVQEGVFGLMEAAKKYDSEKGRFSTYAMIWIRQSISRSIENMSCLVRVPVYIQQEHSSIRKSSIKLNQALGRQCTHYELSQHLKIKELDVVEAFQVKSTMIISFTQEDEDGNVTLMDIEDKSISNPYVSVEAKSISGKINSLISLILHRLKKNHKDRDIYIFFSYYGVNHERKNLEELGSELKITRERVRQIVVSCHKSIEASLPSVDTEVVEKLIKARNYMAEI